MPLPDGFVAKAIDSIVDDGRVIPVRLALLAKILGNENWTEDRLVAITSHKSLSGYYLDMVLGGLSSAAQRQLVKPAQEVLRSLTPASGRMRGLPKSKQDLRMACQRSGQRTTDAEFDDLMDLLDRQLHLVTPIENENEIASASDPTETGEDDSKLQYQLPHDFLVPEIRRWLETQDRQSLSGRASSDLRFAASRWKEDPRKSNLAGPIDCLRFSIFARSPKDDDLAAREFLKTSARKHLLHSLVIGAVVTCMLAFFYSALQHSRGKEIVQRLKSSSWDNLPVAVGEARQNRFWTEGLLNRALREAGSEPADDESDKTQRDRLALALLRYDSNHATYLADRLVEMSPEANLVIANQIRVDLAEKDLFAVADHLAAIASDETQVGPCRLKAAIAIAAIAPEHTFWEQSSEQICHLLVDANPTDLGWLADGLFPVRRQLITGLTGNRGQQNAERSRTATFLLAEFAADDPDSQVDLVKKAAISNLAAIFSTISDLNSDSLDKSLKANFAAVVESWNRRDVDSKGTENSAAKHIPDGSVPSVALARQIGNLGAALILRGHGKLVSKHLRLNGDPTLRSYLIHCYASGNGPAQPIVELLIGDEGNSEGLPSDLPDDVAAALLQMAGSLPASSKVPSSIRELANQLYRNSENTELNATAEWFLRRHGYQADLRGANLPQAIGYRTSEGHTMVQLPGGVVASVGASSGDRNQLPNEKPHDIRVPATIFVSRDELTAEQLRRFIADTEADAAQNHPNENQREKEVRMGFFIAAAYCNWLSEKEGIPKDQWCYLPNREGKIGPGMKIAADHLQRTGYQIPTPDLWEYACRSGTTTPRPFGIGIELSSRYIRWAGTRSINRQRSTVRLPNGFGLIDMLGNGAEWTTGLVDGMLGAPNRMPDFGEQRDRVPPRFKDQEGSIPRHNYRRFQGEEIPHREPGRFRTGQPGLAFGGGPILIDAAGKTIEPSNQFAILGGAFDAPAHKIRSSDRSIISPTMTNKPVTLRLMRILQYE